MEIIILPYMVISLLIGWAVFAPFGVLKDLDDWSFAKLEIGDLLAVLIPTSASLAAASWLVNSVSMHPILVTLVFVTVGLAVVAILMGGLFLLAKMERVPSSKRMTLIGLVLPLGVLLTLGWIAMPILAFTNLAVYSIPATLLIVPVTLGLRRLSGWCCRQGPSACVPKRPSSVP